MNALRKGGRTPIGMILGLLAVLAIGFFLFRGCVGNNNVPVTGNQTGNQPSGEQGQLGRAFAASAVDANGCPVNRTSTFTSNQAIYVGFERSQIPSGTEIFARLSSGGQALEDTRPITADRDMNTCVWFAFQPSGSGFQAGSYNADLFINGNKAETVQLRVDGSGNSGILGGGNNNSNSNVRLGEMITTDQVDNDGCADREVTQFRSNEPVYVAIGRSQIPAGTSMFARLTADGQTLENTEPITADQDINSCVWFVFETNQTGGLQPGSYDVQVFVNNDRGPTTSFSVR